MADEGLPGILWHAGEQYVIEPVCELKSLPLHRKPKLPAEPTPQHQLIANPNYFSKYKLGD